MPDLNNVSRCLACEVLNPLFAILDDTVARHGDRPAISFFGRVWTYRELGNLVERAAAGLAALGVRRGTRVGLCLPNTPAEAAGSFDKKLDVFG